MCQSKSIDESAMLADVYCPKCAYSLFGTHGDRCSECGYVLKGLRSPTCQIPWGHREKGGWLTRYWRTVWMVTFKNATFCEEYARPINYRDARRFQWVTVAHVYIVMLVASWVAYNGYKPKTNVFTPTGSMFYPAFTSATDPWEVAYNERWLPVVVLATVLPLLMAITSLPSYFFHPPTINVKRQNAGIALSYYLCAPLAGVPVIMTGLLPLIWFSDFSNDYGALSAIAIGYSFGVAMLTWWVTLVRSARRVMPQLDKRALSIGIGVPVLWALSAVLIVGAFPVSLLFVILVFNSLS